MKQGQSMSPPSVELVRAIIQHLIAGRRLIGYHVTQKLKELQIVGEMTGMTQSWQSFAHSHLACEADEHPHVTTNLPQGGFIFDSAHLFTNLSPDNSVIVADPTTSTIEAGNEPVNKALQTQLPFDTVCQRFLDVKWRKKRSMPYAFTEAKIQMALYHRWRQLHGLALTQAVLAAKDENQLSIEQVFSEPIKHEIVAVSPVKPKDVPPATNNSAKSKVQVFTGEELEGFIQHHVRQCLRQKIESLLLTL